MYKYSKMYLGGKNPGYMWQNRGLSFSIDYCLYFYSSKFYVWFSRKWENKVNSDESIKYFLHETKLIKKETNFESSFRGVNYENWANHKVASLIIAFCAALHNLFATSIIKN